MARYIDKDQVIEWIKQRLLPTVTNGNYDDWEKGADNERINFLSFINSLTEEPESEDLEEEIKRYSKDILILPLSGDRWQTMEITEGNWVDIACHFAEWQKQRDDKHIGDLQWEAYLKGEQETKQQMMKDVVDATILDIDAQTVELGLWPEKLLDIKEGDKVKIIIVKENG